MSTSALPCYSPSPPAPLYSKEPSCDEQRLAHTLCTDPRPTGTFTKTVGRVALMLHEQEDGTTQPSYGRHALVNGVLCLDDFEVVSEVVLKLEGRIDLTISEGGSKSQKIVNDSYTLWTSDKSQSPCPGVLPFSFAFPSTFKDGNHTRPLPPSYDVSFPGVPGLFAKCFYSLTVVIDKVRHRRLSFLPKRKIFNVRLRYHPRTRPFRPIIDNPCLFSTLKASPEEWHQASAKIQTRPMSKIAAIDCQFFIPSIKIFGLTDTIPFHIHLSGPLASLREFLPPVPVPSDDVPTVKAKPRSHSPSRPAIRVFLQRQVAVEVHGQKAWRNCTLGEGKVWPLPPRVSSTTSPQSDSQEEQLDWEGEVRCREDITVGGFNAGKFSVKDFIVFSLSPPPGISPLLPFQHSIPIRLVSDAWMDISGSGPDAQMSLGQ